MEWISKGNTQNTENKLHIQSKHTAVVLYANEYGFYSIAIIRIKKRILRKGGTEYLLQICTCCDLFISLKLSITQW